MVEASRDYIGRTSATDFRFLHVSTDEGLAILAQRTHPFQMAPASFQVRHIQQARLPQTLSLYPSLSPYFWFFRDDHKLLQ